MIPVSVGCSYEEEKRKTLAYPRPSAIGPAIVNPRAPPKGKPAIHIPIDKDRNLPGFVFSARIPNFKPLIHLRVARWPWKLTDVAARYQGTGYPAHRTAHVECDFVPHEAGDKRPHCDHNDADIE